MITFSRKNDHNKTWMNGYNTTMFCHLNLLQKVNYLVGLCLIDDSFLSTRCLSVLWSSEKKKWRLFKNQDLVKKLLACLHLIFITVNILI